jgi:hypothetical protein
MITKKTSLSPEFWLMLIELEANVSDSELAANEAIRNPILPRVIIASDTVSAGQPGLRQAVEFPSLEALISLK